MMDARVQIVVSGLCLVGLWAAYQFVWRRTALDLFRQQLYAVRDGLFMDVARGPASFNDPAYGMLRMMINSQIRCSATISVVHVIFFEIIRRIFRVPLGPSPLDLDHKFRECIGRMTNESARRIYEHRYVEMLRAIVRHLFRSSICALLLLSVTAVVALVVFSMRGIWNSLRPWGLRYAAVAVNVDKDAPDCLIPA